MIDGPLRLTAEHENVLATIGPSGGTQIRLRDLVCSREIYELGRAGYVWRDVIEMSEPGTDNAAVPIWYLTDLGATTVGIDPNRIYRR